MIHALALSLPPPTFALLFLFSTDKCAMHLSSEEHRVRCDIACELFCKRVGPVGLFDLFRVSERWKERLVGERMLDRKEFGRKYFHANFCRLFYHGIRHVSKRSLLKICAKKFVLFLVISRIKANYDS